MGTTTRKVNLQIDYSLNKASFTQIQNSLKALQSYVVSGKMDISRNLHTQEAQDELRSIITSISQMQQALNNAFNSDLGTINVAKFNKELKNLNVNKIYSDFKSIGPAGEAAFRDITTQVLTTNMQLKQTHNFLNEMSTTMANTIKWGVASSIMNRLSGSVQEAYGYVKRLDSSLNDIRIVTGQSSDEMDRFAEKANKAAKALGASTVDYTDAALIYAQQGLDQEEITARTEITLKAANVTGQSAADVSEQLTAVWNGYKVSADEAELYVDRLAAVAATTASNLEELSVGMSKVAASAAALGVGEDQLAAQLSTIISATRLAPESVGTALKTIYARMTDIEAGLEDIDLGTYSGAMAEMGINVLDATGSLRDMGAVIEEIGGKWGDFTREQQISLAQTMAGTRQYNNLIALFDNWNKYTSTLKTAQNATGTLQQQQDVYMDRVSTHLQRLSTASEGVFDSLLKPEMINGVVDSISIVVEEFERLIDGIGGGGKALTLLGTSMMGLFKGKISEGISTFITNLKNAKYNTEQVNAQLEIMKQFNLPEIDEKTRQLVDMKQSILNLNSLDESEQNEGNQFIVLQNQIMKQQEAWEAAKESAVEYAKIAFGESAVHDLNMDDLISPEYVQQLNERISGYKEEAKNTNALTDALEEYRKELERVNDIASTDGLNEASQYKKTILANLKSSLEEYKEAFESDVAPSLTEDLADSIRKSIQQAQDALQNSDVELSEISSNINNIVETYGSANEEMVEKLKTTLATISREASGESDRLQEQANENITQFENWMKNIKLKDTIEGFVGLAQGIGETAAALNSLTELEGVIKSLREDGLNLDALREGFENLVVTLPAIGQGVMSITGAMKQFAIIEGVATNETSMFKAALDLIKAHPIIAAIGGIVAVIGVAATAIDLFTVSAAEAREELSTSLQEYKQSETELTTLQDQLTSVQDKLKELYKITEDKLTITDKEDILRLEQESRELQAQIDLQKKLVELKRYDVLKNASQALKSGTYNQFNEDSSYKPSNGDIFEFGTNTLTNALGSEFIGNASDEFYNKVLGELIASEFERISDENNIDSFSGAIGENVFNELNKYFKKSRDPSESLAPSIQSYILAKQTENELKDISLGDTKAFEEWKNEYLRRLDLLQEEIGKGTELDSYIDQVQTNNTDFMQDFISRSEAYLNDMSTYFPEWLDVVRAAYAGDYAGYESTVRQYEEYIEKYYTATDSASGLAESVFKAFVNDEKTYDTIIKYFNKHKDEQNFSMKNAFKDIENGEEIFNRMADSAHNSGVSLEFLAGTLVDLGVSFNDLKKDAQIGGNVNLNEEDSTTVNQTKSVLDTYTGDTSSVEELEKAWSGLEPVLGSLLDILNNLGVETDSLSELSLQDIQVLKDYLDGLTQYGYSFNLQLDQTQLKLQSLQQTLTEAQGKIDTDSILNSAISELNENNNLSGYDEETLEKFYDALSNVTYVQEQFNDEVELWNELSKAGVLDQIEFLQDLIAADDDYAQRAIETRQEILQLNIEQHEETMQDLEEEKQALEEELAILTQPVDDITEEEQEQRNQEIEAKTERIEELTQAISDQEAAVLELRDTLDSTDWNWEIQLEGIEQIQTIGDSVLSEADKIEKACELIGKDFIVAAEDAMELAYVMPEILQNATVLADGQIQLSDDVANVTLGNQQAILQGDVDTTIAMIEDQISELEAKKKAAEAELVLANTLAEAKIDVSQQEADILADVHRQLTDYYIGLNYDEVTASHLAADDVVTIYNGLQDQGEITWDNIYKYAEDANQDLVTNTDDNGVQVKTIWQTLVEAAQNYWRAAEGDTTVAVNTGKAGTAIGGGGVSRRDHGAGLDPLYIHETDPTVFTHDDWQKRLLGNISEYERKIAELKALEAELLAKNRQTQEKLDNSRNGLGGNYQKDDSGSSKGSGGDKGGSSKDAAEKESDYIDALVDEADIYHDINLELKRLSNELSKLEKEEDGLFGKELIENLNEQLDILEKQKEAQEEKLKIAKEEAKTLRDSLAEEGVTFDENGFISNYKAALEAKLNHVNEVIKAYNALSAEEQEDYKDVVESAKNDYENFKKLIEEYDEMISDTIPELEENIQDTLDKEIEIKMQKFTMAIDIELDLSEAERNWNDFKKKVIDEVKEDDAIGNARSALKDMETYTGNQNGKNGIISSLMDQVNATMKEIEAINEAGFSSVYGDNKAQALEDLRKYTDELMDSMMSVEDLSNEIKEDYLDLIDQMKDAFDEQVDKYEAMQGLLESDSKLVGLLYGDDAYDAMNDYYTKSAEYHNQEMDFLKKRADFAQSMLQRDDLDEEAKKKWEEEWMDSIEKLNSEVEKAVQNIIDKYKNGVKQVIEAMNDEVSGGLGLDYLEEEWDLVNKNADRYLDSINRIYELDSLKSKFNDAIDNTDSIKNQQRLNDLMDEELGKLAERDRISQYDIDRANKRLEITLKQIALEEAQQAKTELRLRRDSQGNYTYQFVADQEEIENALQDLLDLQNELYNFDKEKYIENLNEIYDVYTEFQQKLYDLYSDQTLTAEERQVKEKLLVEQYQSLINGIVEDNNNIRENLSQSAFEALAGLYKNDEKEFEKMADANAEKWVDMTNGFNTNFKSFSETHKTELEDLMRNTVVQWNTGAQSMADSFKNTIDESGNEVSGFEKIVEEVIENLNQKVVDFNVELGKIEVVSGKSFGALSSAISDEKTGVLAQMDKLIDDNDELIEQYADMITEMEEVLSKLQDLNTWYRQLKKSAEEAAEAAQKMWEQQQHQAADEAKKDQQNSSQNSGGDSTKQPNNSGGDSNLDKDATSPSKPQQQSKGPQGDGVPQVGDIVTYTGQYYFSSWGVRPVADYLHDQPNAVQIKEVTDGTSKYGEYGYRIGPVGHGNFGWVKLEQLSGYDTGGYTGAWGDDGKLAVLHQKELVLNKDDTKNLLNAVSIVRAIDSAINSMSSALNSRFELAGANASLIGNDRVVQQDVHIDASFPNVKDHNEIEIALNNLTNIASQYAFNSQR